MQATRNAREGTTFDQFYLWRYATAVVPLTLAAAVASVPGLVVLWHAPALPVWQGALAVSGVAALFVLTWLSRVFARRVAVLAITAAMGMFATIAVTLAAWEAHLRNQGAISVLPTAMVVSFVAASFCVRYWQVVLSWGLVLAPILAFAAQEPPALHQTSQLMRFAATMVATSTIFYAAVIRVKWGYFHLIRQLRAQSRTDALTGLLNRTAWVEDVERVLAQAPADASPLVLYLDIDRFKQINDGAGHAEGDRVLAGVAGVLVRALGDDALIARFGGDEFVVFLPDGSLAQVEARMASLRAEVSMLRTGCPLTLSAGVARASLERSIDDALGRADRALLAAKAGGRNRLVEAA